MRFRATPHEVDAVQFTGDNWLEMINFCGVVERGGEVEPVFNKLHLVDVFVSASAPGAKAVMYSERLKDNVYIAPDNWIVRAADGHLFAATDPIFTKMFEKIEDA